MWSSSPPARRPGSTPIGRRGKAFTPGALKEVAAAVGDAISHQRHGHLTLAPAEVLDLLTRYVVARTDGTPMPSIPLGPTPIGPTSASPPLSAPLTCDASQFLRSCADVSDQLAKHGRVPSAVWLGGRAAPPEAFLRAVAGVAGELLTGKPMPKEVELRPTPLAAAKHVAEDDPRLWGWVIFPPGFRAPHLMEVARRQAWTIKPALLRRE